VNWSVLLKIPEKITGNDANKDHSAGIAGMQPSAAHLGGAVVTAARAWIQGQNPGPRNQGQRLGAPPSYASSPPSYASSYASSHAHRPQVGSPAMQYVDKSCVDRLVEVPAARQGARLNSQMGV